MALSECILPTWNNYIDISPNHNFIHGLLYRKVSPNFRVRYCGIYVFFFIAWGIVGVIMYNDKTANIALN